MKSVSTAFVAKCLSPVRTAQVGDEMDGTNHRREQRRLCNRVTTDDTFVVEMEGVDGRWKEGFFCS